MFIQSPSYPLHDASAHHVLLHIIACSVCPPVPSQGYVYNLVIFVFAFIVPTNSPEMEGYGFSGLRSGRDLRRESGGKRGG